MHLRFGGAQFIEEDLVELREPSPAIQVIKTESEREARFLLGGNICLCHEVV